MIARPRIGVTSELVMSPYAPKRQHEAGPADIDAGDGAFDNGPAFGLVLTVCGSADANRLRRK